jgi:hypothetical protein
MKGQIITGLITKRFLLTPDELKEQYGKNPMEWPSCGICIEYDGQEFFIDKNDIYPRNETRLRMRFQGLEGIRSKCKPSYYSLVDKIKEDYEIGKRVVVRIKDKGYASIREVNDYL